MICAVIIDDYDIYHIFAGTLSLRIEFVISDVVFPADGYLINDPGRLIFGYCLRKNRYIDIPLRGLNAFGNYIGCIE